MENNQEPDLLIWNEELTDEYEDRWDINLFSKVLNHYIETKFPDQINDFLKVYDRLIKLEYNEESIFPIIQFPCVGWYKQLGRTEEEFIDLAEVIINPELFEKTDSRSRRTFIYQICDVTIDNFLVRNPLDSSANVIYKAGMHEYAPDISYKLHRLGYTRETINTLVPEIIKELESLNRFLKNDDFTLSQQISTAIIRTCRRGNRQCPVRLKKHYNNAKKIFKKHPQLKDVVVTHPKKLVENNFIKFINKINNENIDKIEKIKATIIAKGAEYYYNLLRNRMVINASQSHSAIAAAFIYISACVFNSNAEENEKKSNSPSYYTQDYILKLTGSNNATMRKYYVPIKNELIKMKEIEKKVFINSNT